MNVEGGRAVQPLDCRYLLLIYGVMPLLWGMLGLDLAVWDRLLLDHYLPEYPRQWFIWSVIFIMPHIIASLFTFADRQYIQHYRSVFSVVFPLIIIGTVVLHQVIGGVFSFAIFAAVSLYHVLAQQFGLTLMMLGKKPESDYFLWKWLSLGAALLVYTVIYGKHFLISAADKGEGFIRFSLYASMMFYTAAFVYARRLARQSRSVLGKWYLWANVLMVGSCLMMTYLGYAVFAIILPRFIHDFTAYCVYIVHDSNREMSRRSNPIYRLAGHLRVPVWVACPLVSMIIAYPLTFASNDILVLLTLSLIYLHYYYEHFIWRGGSLHRRHIAFLH